MKLINNTRCVFKASKGDFAIGKIMDFDAEEARVLLKYEGINKIEDLEEKSTPAKSKTEFDLLKEEATELGIDYPGNVSKAKLVELIEEAKTAPDVTGE